MKRSTPILTLILSGLLLSIPAEAQDLASPPTPDETAAIELARLSGTVDALRSQIDAERAMNAQVLETVNTVITVYTGAVAVIVFILGLLGYTNLRTHLRREMERKVDAQLAELVTTRMETFIGSKTAEWDAKFDKLYRSAQRLGN